MHGPSEELEASAVRDQRPAMTRAAFPERARPQRGLGTRWSYKKRAWVPKPRPPPRATPGPRGGSLLFIRATLPARSYTVPVLRGRRLLYTYQLSHASGDERRVILSGAAGVAAARRRRPVLQRRRRRAAAVATAATATAATATAATAVRAWARSGEGGRGGRRALLLATAAAGGDGGGGVGRPPPEGIIGQAGSRAGKTPARLPSCWPSSPRAPAAGAAFEGGVSRRIDGVPLREAADTDCVAASGISESPSVDPQHAAREGLCAAGVVIEACKATRGGGVGRPRVAGARGAGGGLASTPAGV